MSKHAYKYGEESCGIIPISSDYQKVLIIRCGKYWQFPKGFREQGETQKQTAIRETKEEVNIKFTESDLGKKFILTYEYVVTPSILRNHLKDIKQFGGEQYMFPGIRHRKIVLYMATTSIKKVKRQKIEVDEVRWVPWELAWSLMRYSRQRQVLRSVISLLLSKGIIKNIKIKK